MGQGHHGESLTRYAFVSSLPSDVSMHLKPTVNAERIELPQNVWKARAMLALRVGNSIFACTGVRSSEKTVKHFVSSGNGHIGQCRSLVVTGCQRTVVTSDVIK